MEIPTVEQVGNAEQVSWIDLGSSQTSVKDQKQQAAIKKDEKQMFSCLQQMQREQLDLTPETVQDHDSAGMFRRGATTQARVAGAQEGKKTPMLKTDAVCSSSNTNDHEDKVTTNS